MQKDSIDKLLHRIGLLARKPIKRKGVVFAPAVTEIYVSPALLRSFKCHLGCTACCLPFTVDFSPDEFTSFPWSQEVRNKAKDLFEQRNVEVNDRKYLVFTYHQYRDKACQFLTPNREGGALGCSFYPNQPLECAAAPQLLMTTRGDVSVITKRPFGRASQWKNVPQCEFSPTPTPVSELLRASRYPTLTDDPNHPLANEIMLLKRYQHFAEYFELDTYIKEAIEALGALPSYIAEATTLHKNAISRLIRIV
jgi:Fe-S-cluster containining protein